MTVTKAETKAWTEELSAMIANTTDEKEMQALTALQGQLLPFFDHPASFKTMLSKIQRSMMSADIENELTSRTFNDVSVVEALLPDGVKVTSL